MEIGFTLALFLVLAGILFFANLEDRHAVYRWLVWISLIGLNLLLSLVGLMSLAGDSLFVDAGLGPATAAGFVSLYRAVGIMGLVAFVPMIKPVRTLLARVIPINPNSTLHMAALVYAVYLVGSGLGQQPLLSDPEALQGLGDSGVGMGAIWVQTLGLVLVALAGVGLFTRRTLREVAARLGLRVPTLRQVLFGLVMIGVLLGLQLALTKLWQMLDPAGLGQIDEASNLLLGDMTGLSGAFTIGMAAALGEEILFRGAMLPPFGVLLTSLLFTISHSQYGLTLATGLIMMIALVLAFVRQRTNLTIAILVHFGYNFLLVMLSSLGQ